MNCVLSALGIPHLSLLCQKRLYELTVRFDCGCYPYLEYVLLHILFGSCFYLEFFMNNSGR